ncbi:DUF6612 family protein [Paenibacillus wynnii]|uniref:Uncharacterized protein n=1 Tax=Paenibacillus wynnii TaxID=268407 RepID=A0A098M3F4_9BACL|nr:DUF6612 family protein [Paenibacillus wynnii]KGE17039.1 hypothetical protein PWYN_20490 [Paenibacillus wynnii]
MKRNWKAVCTGIIAGAMLLTGNTGWMSQSEVASAASAKPLTVDQVIGKLTASSKTLKSYHLNSNKKLDIQTSGMSFSVSNTLDIDINRLPKFSATGTNELKYFGTESSFDLYANDKEFYQLLDGSMLIEQNEDETTVSEDDVTGESGEEPIDPDAQYWVLADKLDWDALYTKGQFDPASMLDSVKNYKKSMKVSDVGSQTVLQFTITEPKAAKMLIELYDQDIVMDSGTIQPKSVTWKLYANKKTWQTEKLTVNLSYSLVVDGEKDTHNTKIEAKYSNHNKVAVVVKPAELE